MPVSTPPVGPARARRMRLMALRESLANAELRVDVDAVAEAITRRAVFNGELRRHLAQNG